MEDNKFHIVIVDDTMGEKDPFVVNLKLDFDGVAYVSYFNNVESAMSFIDNHMSERIIVFMDCKFGSVWQGVDAVLELRKKTSLIYVIMMSANPANQLTQKDIASLINADNIFFIKNTDTSGAVEKIETIRGLWKSQFDCILEGWLLRHPEDHNKIAYSVAGGKSYTWKDILVELRLRTQVGKAMEQMVNEYYLYEYSSKN